jgi:hypothetical protein
LTQKLVDEAINGLTCIRRANVPKIHNGLGAESDYLYRRSQQMEAHAHYGALYSLVDLAYNLGYTNANCTEKWTELIVDTDDLLMRWIKANKEEYLSKNTKE